MGRGRRFGRAGAPGHTWFFLRCGGGGVTTTALVWSRRAARADMLKEVYYTVVWS